MSAGCRINAVPDDQRDLITIDTGIEGRVVYLPPMQGLLMNWVAYEGPEKGTFAIVPPVELPFGGIANFDFCGIMTLIETRAVKRRGDALRYLTLRLRSALDLEVDYPSAYSVIQEKRLLLTSPSSRYVEVLTDEPEDFVAWLTANKPKMPWLSLPYPIIALSDRVFIPTN